MNNSESLSFFDFRQIPSDKLGFDFVKELEHDTVTNEFIVHYQSGNSKRLPTINPDAPLEIESAEINAQGELVVTFNDASTMNVGRVSSRSFFPDITPVGSGLLVDPATNRFKELNSVNPGIVITKSAGGVHIVITPPATEEFPVGTLDFDNCLFAELRGTENVITAENGHGTGLGLTYPFAVDEWGFIKFEGVDINAFGPANADGTYNLTAGQYYCNVNVFLWKVDLFDLELYNVTTQETLLTGIQCYNEKLASTTYQDSSGTALAGEFVLDTDAIVGVRCKATYATANKVFSYSHKIPEVTYHVAAQMVLFKVTDLAGVVSNKPGDVVADHPAVAAMKALKAEGNVLEKELFPVIGNAFKLSGTGKVTYGYGVTTEQNVGLFFPRDGKMIAGLDYETGICGELSPGGVIPNNVVAFGAATTDSAGVVYPAPIDYSKFIAVTPSDPEGYPRTEVSVSSEGVPGDRYEFNSYTITNRATPDGPTTVQSVNSWELQGRNAADEEWVVIDSQSGQTDNNPESVRTYPLSSKVAFKEVRLYITETNGGNIFTSVGKLELLLDGVDQIRAMSAPTSAEQTADASSYWQEGAIPCPPWLAFNHVVDYGWVSAAKATGSTPQWISITNQASPLSATGIAVPSTGQENMVDNNQETYYEASRFDASDVVVEVPLIGSAPNNDTPWATLSDSKSGADVWKLFRSYPAMVDNYWSATSSGTEPEEISVTATLPAQTLVTSVRVANRVTTAGNNSAMPGQFRIQYLEDSTQNWLDWLVVTDHPTEEGKDVEYALPTKRTAGLRIVFTDSEGTAPIEFSLGALQWMTLDSTSGMAVPVLPTTDGGTGQSRLFGTDYVVGFEPSKAFNGTTTNANDCWKANVLPTPESPVYLGVETLREPMKIGGYSVTTRVGADVDGTAPVDWVLQGRNTLSEGWVDIDTVVGNTQTAPGASKSALLGTPVAYRAYRLKITAVSGPGTTTDIGAFTLVPSAVSQADWADDFIYALTPMTANEQNGQLASASNTRTGNFEPWKAFTNSLGTGTYDSWVTATAASPSNPYWLGMSFTTEPKKIVGYRMGNRNYTAAPSETSSPRDWVFQGRVDAQSPWIDLHTVKGYSNNNPGAISSWILPVPMVLSDCRIYITANNGTKNWVCIGDLGLYTQDDLTETTVTVGAVNTGANFTDTVVVNDTANPISAIGTVAALDSTGSPVTLTYSRTESGLVFVNGDSTGIKELTLTDVICEDPGYVRINEIGIAPLSSTLINMGYHVLGQGVTHTVERADIVGPDAATGSLRDALEGTGGYVSVSNDAAVIDITLGTPEVVKGVKLYDSLVDPVISAVLYGVTDADEEVLISASIPAEGAIYCYSAGQSVVYSKVRIKITKGTNYTPGTPGTFGIGKIELAVPNAKDLGYRFGFVTALNIPDDVASNKYSSAVYCPRSNKVLYIPKTKPTFMVYDVAEGTATEESFGLATNTNDKYGVGVYCPVDGCIYVPAAGSVDNHLKIDLVANTAKALVPIKGVDSPTTGRFSEAFITNDGRVAFSPDGEKLWNVYEPLSGVLYADLYGVDPVTIADKYPNGAYGADGQYWIASGNSANSKRIDGIDRSNIIVPDKVNIITADKEGSLYLVDCEYVTEIYKYKPSVPHATIDQGLYTKRLWMVQ